MVAAAPTVVARYLAAAEMADFVALADCFTPDGTVLDEGRTYRGRAAIIEWRQALAGTWTYTITITDSRQISEHEYRVGVRAEGNFPGGIANLTYRFSIHDDLIVDLSIVE